MAPLSVNYYMLTHYTIMTNAFIKKQDTTAANKYFHCGLDEWLIILH